MSKAVWFTLILAINTPVLPETDIVKSLSSIVTPKNTECIIGLILATALCGQNNNLSRVLGVTLFLASLGFYASDYRSVHDLCKSAYRSLTR